MKKTILLVLVLALILTAGVANADFTFGEPANMGPTVNTASIDAGPSISADGLSLYFHSSRPGGSGAADLWVTKRPTVSAPWDTAVNLGALVNSGAEDRAPSISADGLELYFHSGRPGGHGSIDMWMTTRETSGDSWRPPVNLGPTLNTSVYDRNPDISADGLSLYFVSNRPGGYGDTDFWVSTRTTKNHDWGTPVHLGSTVNSSYLERQPTISDDGLWLFFHSNLPGGLGNEDIWVTTRATTDDDWEAPVNLGPTVNGSAHDFHPDISGDGSTLYFGSMRPGGVGGEDLWQVPILPVVDFTGDYRVDIDDLLILIEHWGQNEPSVDMAPTPLGDGAVDAADLEVLMSYWGQAFDDPHFIAHWALDEAEGMFATESINGNDGIVFGDPVWQPEGGQINGALEFDGLDDMIIAKFVLDPEEGPFSVFAWIQGGAPGQVIISQQGGVNWLQVDADGTLMTELTKSGGRTKGASLYSEAVITDGNWHRIGFVWNGSQRILYVDDIPVALDQQSGLTGSTGGLVIGAGKGTQAGTLWSGMIDDVRVYDRVVEP